MSDKKASPLVEGNTALPRAGEKDMRTESDTESQASEDLSKGLEARADAGIKRIEAVSLTWTTKSLVVAYIGIFLISFSTSLQQQTTYNYSSIVTSALGHHSAVATVGVVQSVMFTVWKIPMAKIADVFGRLEAFSISVILYTIGFAMSAGSKNIATYAGSQVFYAAGFTGLQILQQIFIADSSDLLWRGFWSTLPDIPFLITVWVGSEIASRILGPEYLGSWQWGYGMWAIIIPVSFIPLALSLYLNQRKAAKRGQLPPLPWRVNGWGAFLKEVWFDMDIMGLLLLSAAFCLILIPLTLGGNAGNSYGKGSYIAMFVVGGICFIAFPLWESSKTLCPKPAIPLNVLKERTVLVGCAIAFFYFMAFYLCVFPYYYSWLLVVNNTGIVAAGRILNSFSFTSTVASLVVGILIFAARHYKYFVTAGACIYLLGIGLLYHYRQPGTSTGTLVGLQICRGIGGGMLNVPAQVGVQSVARHQDVAMVTSLFLTFLELGGAIGQGISGSVWSQNFPKYLDLYLPEDSKNLTSTLFSGLTLEFQKYPVGSPVRLAVNRAVNDTMRKFMIGSIIVAAFLIPLSLFMKNVKLDKVDQKVRGKVIGKSKRADTDTIAKEEIIKS